jgi:hypothetical protein
VLGATAYNVRRGLAATGPFDPLGAVAESAYLDENLANGKRYYYVVTAQNDAGESLSTVSVVGVPGLQPPPQPASLSAAPGDLRVELSWPAPARAETYAVKRSETKGGPYEVVSQDVIGSTYTNTGLVNGRTYYYVVTARNAAGESRPSREVAVRPTADRLIQDTDESIVYSSPDFTRTASADASGGTVHVGWRTGNTLQLSFTGVGIEIYGPKFAQGKTAALYLDDLANPVATNVSWKATPTTPQSLIWASPILDKGDHTLLLEVRGDWIEVDFFHVLTEVPLGSLSAAWDNGKPAIRWTGAGTLQSADSLGGPWTPVPEAASPFVVSPALGTRFFRLSR